MPSSKVQHFKQPAQQQTQYSKSEKTDHGEIDEELADGPLAKRSCRDPLCCLIFVAFMAGMIGIAGYSLSKGDPYRIGRGFDSDKNICGIDPGFEEHPILYFVAPRSGYLYRTVCVRNCPSNPTSVPDASSLDCKTNSEVTGDCTIDRDQTSAVSDPDGDLGTFVYGYDSVKYVGRFCLPTTAASSLSAVQDLVFNSDLFEQWVSDITETWPVIAISIGFAFVVGVIYMIFLRYCTGVFTWLGIIAFIVGKGVLGWRFYMLAKETEDETPNSEGNSENTILMEKIIAYACWGIAGLAALAVLCMFNRIRLAVAILKAAADYIKSTPSVFLLPPFTILILVIFFAYWGATLLFLISSGDIKAVSEDIPFGTFEFDKTLQRLLIYHLFGLLWFNAFVIAATQFVIASSVCLWYFSQGSGQAAPKTIRTSIYRLVRYHFGSIAFGAFILAVVQLIRIILAYIDKQSKKMGGSENKFVKFVLKCTQCYLACFERFIKFLNKNAYIQIALTGKSFCGAAKDAFTLIMKNPLRIGITSGLSTVFVWFGKVLIAVLTALAAYFAITQLDTYKNDVSTPFLPTLVCFVFAYVIGAVFMTVYGLAADTILACFIVDEDINSRKNAPPRHCPETLRDFIENNKKKN